ncbi:hypothetical protein ABVK25_005464 [Lepraria finkii]|uniref:DUF7730 domain-containing protein n=1 Tax=Lepraria finkii TaxID=1340010 RepID=A0ABR4BEL3_9LECA
MGRSNDSQAFEKEKSINNSKSPLLSLPQEPKDQIYALNLGHRTLHIHHNKQPYILRHFICCAPVLDAESHQQLTSPSATRPNAANTNPHSKCNNNQKTGTRPGRVDALNLSLLRTCRQIYTEVKMVPAQSEQHFSIFSL